MKRNARQSDRLDWRGSWAFFRLTFWILASSVVLLAVLVLWNHRESVDRSMAERLSTLERKVAQESPPVINVQNASIYSMEGELVIKTFPPREKIAQQ